MEEKYQEWFDNFSDQFALSEISGIGELHVVRCAFLAGCEAAQQPLAVDVANAFCKCADPQWEIREECGICGKPPRH